MNLDALLAIGSGYRTYVAAAILALTGLIQLLGALSDALDGNFTKAWPDLQLALTTLGQALAAFGLRAAVARNNVTA